VAAHRVLVPADQPVLPVAVVHREDAVGAQVGAHRLHRLQGEQVALQTDLACPRDQGERIRQGEDDRVVRPVGALQEGAAVVDVDVHARIGVRVVRIELSPQLLYSRVDLDGVHRGRAVSQGLSDVDAVARTDHQHITRVATCRALVRQGVPRLVPPGRQRGDVLVGDPIDQDGRARVGSSCLDQGLDLVVRRPRDAGAESLGEQHADDDDRGSTRHESCTPRRAEQHDRRHRDQRAPDDRGRPQERRDRERGDAEQAADEVPAIGLQPRQHEKAPAREFSRPRHDPRHADEDHRQHHPYGRPDGLQRREEDQVGAGSVDRHRNCPDEDHQHSEHDREVQRDAPRPAGAQEADADAQEAAQ
jgi:hypothetical protein